MTMNTNKPPDNHTQHPHLRHKRLTEFCEVPLAAERAGRIKRRGLAVELVRTVTLHLIGSVQEVVKVVVVVKHLLVCCSKDNRTVQHSKHRSCPSSLKPRPCFASHYVFCMSSAARPTFRSDRASHPCFGEG